MRPSCQSKLPTMTIDSLQLGNGWLPSGSSPGLNDLLRDHSACRIRLGEPRHVSKYSQLALSYQAGNLMGNPSLTEKSIIGDKVIPAIAQDPVKKPSTKLIQTATFAGSAALCLTAI